MSRILLGLWLFSTATMAQTLSPAGSTFQKPTMHSLSLEKDFWVEVCSKPITGKKCEIIVKACGMGARVVEAYQRKFNGLVSLVLTENVTVSGFSTFKFSFDSPGDYNLLFLARSPSGKILAIDGVIFTVRQDTPFFRVGNSSESADDDSDDDLYYLDE